MKFKTNRCPECGAPPHAIVQSVLLTTHLAPDPFDGDGFEHDESKIVWDSAEYLEDESGEKVMVSCVNHHDWFTEVL